MSIRIILTISIILSKLFSNLNSMSCISVETFQEKLAHKVAENFDIMDLIDKDRNDRNVDIKEKTARFAESEGKMSNMAYSLNFMRDRSVDEDDEKNASSNQSDMLSKNDRSVLQGKDEPNVRYTPSLKSAHLTGYNGRQNESKNQSNEKLIQGFKMQTQYNGNFEDPNRNQEDIEPDRQSGIDLSETFILSNYNYRGKGKGAMSTTYSLQFTNHNQKRATSFVKIVKDDGSMNNNVANELFVINKFFSYSSLYNMRYFGCVEHKMDDDTKRYALFMEEMAGSLDKDGSSDVKQANNVSNRDFFSKLKDPSSETTLGVIYMMLKETQLLHQNNIIHCDIKPANFVLGKKFPIVKIIDFGLSISIDPQLDNRESGTSEDKSDYGFENRNRVKLNGCQGFTLAFLDPALFKDGIKNTDFVKFDAYSLGLTLVNILYNKELVYTDAVENELKLSLDFERSKETVTVVNRNRYDGIKDFFKLSESEIYKKLETTKKEATSEHSVPFDSNNITELLNNEVSNLNEYSNAKDKIDILNMVILGMIDQEFDNRMSVEQALPIVEKLLKIVEPNSDYLESNKDNLWKKVYKNEDDNIFYPEFSKPSESVISDAGRAQDGSQRSEANYHLPVISINKNFGDKKNHLTSIKRGEQVKVTEPVQIEQVTNNNNKKNELIMSRAPRDFKIGKPTGRKELQKVPSRLPLANFEPKYPVFRPVRIDKLTALPIMQVNQPNKNETPKHSKGFLPVINKKTSKFPGGLIGQPKRNNLGEQLPTEKDRFKLPPIQPLSNKTPIKAKQFKI